jgi:hypothetical protein
MAEQRTFNPLVQGSTPWRPTQFDQVRRGTSATFLTKAPILVEGRIGVVADDPPEHEQPGVWHWRPGPWHDRKPAGGEPMPVTLRCAVRVRAVRGLGRGLERRSRGGGGMIARIFVFMVIPQQISCGITTIMVRARAGAYAPSD